MGLAAFVNKVYNAQVGGAGVVMTKYPVAAIGVTCTGSSKTVGVYKFSAAGANVKAVVAAGLTVPYKWAGMGFDTPSVGAVYVFRAGRGAAAAAAMTQVIAEFQYEVATDAGGYAPVFFPPGSVPIVNVDANNGALAEATSNSAAQDDTINVSAMISTLIAT